MLYLNSKDMMNIGINWKRVTEIIRESVDVMNDQDFSQPIKPYLNFDDSSNRMIAMPAFIGGHFSVAGIKWIASFPKNIEKNLARANAVTILNDANTGVPFAIMNGTILSGIRTAAVSGLMIQVFDQVRDLNHVTVGIIGFGPIGQFHLQMVINILGDKIDQVMIFDLLKVDQNKIPEKINKKVIISSSWQEVYQDSDILMTCTVSSKGYIDLSPKQGSLILNVSLRDFKPEVLDYHLTTVVDNWEEVCRANTDIHVMHNERGLQKSDTLDIKSVICDHALDHIPKDQTVIFHPMGMAVFDIAVAQYYYQKAVTLGYGQHLEK